MTRWNWGDAFLFVGGYLVAHIGVLIDPPDYWFTPFIVALLALPLLAWMFRHDSR